MKSPARQNVRPELRARGAGLAHLGNGYPAIGTRTSSSAAQLPGHALLMRRVRLLRARGTESAVAAGHKILREAEAW